MESYGQWCPVAHASEVLADRWTLLIIRELLAGVCHFNDLERGLPGISRTLLAQRLRRLERTGVVERQIAPNGRTAAYLLTAAGQDLQPVVDAAGAWGARWAFPDPRPEELDPGLLLWWMRRRIRTELLPARRIVVQFDFPGARKERFWLLLTPTEVSLCLDDPGFDPDVLVTANLASFYKVWLGRLPLETALRAGTVLIEGHSTLVRAFPRWLEWSPMAPAVRAGDAAARLAADGVSSTSLPAEPTRHMKRANQDSATGVR
jgi:DNA-binding HxlR family transcriptional regulator